MLSAPEKMRITFPIIGFVARGKRNSNPDALEPRTNVHAGHNGISVSQNFSAFVHFVSLCELIVLGFFRLGGFFFGADHCRKSDMSLFPRFVARLGLQSHRQF
jgi:hypothetical protein